MTMFEPTIHVIRKTLHTHKKVDSLQEFPAAFFHLFVFSLLARETSDMKGMNLKATKI